MLSVILQNNHKAHIRVCKRMVRCKGYLGLFLSYMITTSKLKKIKPWWISSLTSNLKKSSLTINPISTLVGFDVLSLNSHWCFFCTFTVKEVLWMRTLWMRRFLDDIIVTEKAGYLTVFNIKVCLCKSHS